jgi:tetratricopeptide (TPR) repeat protein
VSNQQREEAALPSDPARILETPHGIDPCVVDHALIELVARDLARHTPEPPMGESGAVGGPALLAPKPLRREAEAELVRVHRLEQAALLRKAVDLAGAVRFARWAFSSPTSAPIGLAAWRKLCDEELLFARLDGAPVPDELHRVRVLDPMDWGSLTELARCALELERSPRNRLLLARALVLDGEYERAHDLLRALLERPGTPLQRARLHTTLGCVLEALDDPAAALAEHERAIALGGDLTCVLSCLMLGFALGDRPRTLFAVELLERHDRRVRGAARRLQRAVRRARMRFELANGRPPSPAPALSSLALECVCDGVSAVAEATYQLFA